MDHKGCDGPQNRIAHRTAQSDTIEFTYRLHKDGNRRLFRSHAAISAHRGVQAYPEGSSEEDLGPTASARSNHKRVCASLRLPEPTAAPSRTAPSAMPPSPGEKRACFYDKMNR